MDWVQTILALCVHYLLTKIEHALFWSEQQTRMYCQWNKKNTSHLIWVIGILFMMVNKTAVLRRSSIDC